MLHTSIIIIEINNITTNIFLFLITLFSNKKYKIRYAQAKYKLYRINPFSWAPQPKSSKIQTENNTHKNDILAILFFLFNIKLITINTTIIIPIILTESNSIN